jgi:DNA-binding HxlR family transcriptional regulator
VTEEAGAPPVLPLPEGALPSTQVLALIGEKWTAVVLYALSLRGVGHFNELTRDIPGISKKMLVKTLRQLEADGLVERTVFPVVPPKVEYRLTEDGHRLRVPIAQLCQWGLENAEFVAAIAAQRQSQPG